MNLYAFLKINGGLHDQKNSSFSLWLPLRLICFCHSSGCRYAPKSKSVPLSQQVQDLRETVLQLQKQVDYLEMLVPPSTAVLMPDARKLSSIRVNGATFLMSIDKPSGNAKGSDFVLTVVNPQSITYTNVAFDIRVYGKDANGDPNAYKNALLVSRVTPLSHRARQHSSVLPYRACRLRLHGRLCCFHDLRGDCLPCNRIAAR